MHSIANVFISVSSFSNLTTLYLTKGYNFFSDFINSNYACYPNVLKYHSATYPNKIIEVATNFTQTGGIKYINSDLDKPAVKEKTGTKDKEKKEDKDKENKHYLKISNIIAENIKKNEDINKLKKFYEKGYLTKTELEILFNKYGDVKVFPIVGIFGGSNKQELITFRHIEHITKYKLYENYNNDFLNSYIDTVRTVSQVIGTQPKVREYLKNRGKAIPKVERETLEEYLNIKEGAIFEIRNSRALKRLHDNMSVMYSTFQDATKVQRYSEAVEKHFNLNCLIDLISFEVIPSAIELQREHQIMHHCINTYLDRIGKGEYLAVRIKDIISNEQATLGLVINNKMLKFDQLKSFWNSRATNDILTAVHQFFKQNKIELRDGTSRDLTPDPGSVRPTADCLNPKDTIAIKALIRKAQKEKKDSKNETDDSKTLELPEILKILNDYKKLHKIDK